MIYRIFSYPRLRDRDGGGGRLRERHRALPKTQPQVFLKSEFLVFSPQGAPVCPCEAVFTELLLRILCIRTGIFPQGAPGTGHALKAARVRGALLKLRAGTSAWSRVFTEYHQRGSSSSVNLNLTIQRKFTFKFKREFELELALESALVIHTPMTPRFPVAGL